MNGKRSVGLALVPALIFAAPLCVPARDPLALLAWLTLLAAPAGASLCIARRAPAGQAVPWTSRWAPWTLALLLAAFARASLPGGSLLEWTSSSCALIGLAFGGAAVARGRGAGPRAAAGLLVGVGLLCALPSAGGLLRGQPWPAAVAARLLDVSPLTLVAECGGVDWMRHPFVYEPAGGASIGPTLRSPWGVLAGPLAFVVGCTLLFTVRACFGRPVGPKGPEDPSHQR